MRLNRMIGSSFWAAALSLAMPAMQAHAEECVTVNGLVHCGLGGARVTEKDKTAEVENPDTSGKGGVAIRTGPAMVWTGKAFIESDSAESKTTFSSVSEGKTTSTVSVGTDGDKTFYAMDFSSSGAKSYSAFVYKAGQMQASLGKIQGINWNIWVNPGIGHGPNCRPAGQSVNSCLNSCSDTGYFNCDYCWAPCRFGFNDGRYQSLSWRFQLAHNQVHLPDGRVVDGDELVISEENGSTSSEKGFDEIHIQTTAKKTVLSDEDVVNVCSDK